MLLPVVRTMEKIKEVVVTKYTKKSAVFRDAVKDSYMYWTEDYIINKYGNLTVRLESRSEQTRHLPEGALGLGLDLISNFIRNYQNADAYVISQIPMPMEEDILIPPCLR